MRRHAPLRTMLFMRCASIHSCGDGTWTGAHVYDKEDFPDQQQYERTGSATMSHIVLTVLVAVVGFIAVLAAWTSA